ncbi:MAG: FtsX-like permease family protein [Lachnospiraceae bacterium]|nr:FtsX-like permease family protein [Lachnospiraceae bacterium]
MQNRLADSDDYALNEDVSCFMGVSDNTLFNTLALSVGSVMVLIIMFSSVFLIYNSFNISLNERTHQFGILISVGDTEKQLQNSVLFEGSYIGIMGILLVVAAGIGGIALILPFIEQNFGTIVNSNTPLNLSVSVPALAVPAAVI